MTTMTGELTEFGRNPISWAMDKAAEVADSLFVVCALAAAIAFPLHFVFNSLVSVTGWPHAVGGYWNCTLVALGFVTVVFLLGYALALLDHSVGDRDDTGLASTMVAIGIAAWLVTLVS